MAENDRWCFSREQLENTPSRRCGIDADTETLYRQQTSNLIQDIGQCLSVTQLCINTAIVYMHRFCMFHSFTKFNRNSVAACALFVASKAEEQPRKLEHLIKFANRCLRKEEMDVNSKIYKKQEHELLINENIMLQTLGFDIRVEHPHVLVAEFCESMRAGEEFRKRSYFMATYSLRYTTLCLQYKPTVVACVCIHSTHKRYRCEIPQLKNGKDGKGWFNYIDANVTLSVIEELTSEFLALLNKYSSRSKKNPQSLKNKKLSEDVPHKTIKFRRLN